MQGVATLWILWMQKGWRKNAILHPEMQRMQVACREDTTNLPKDAGDAKWLQQACRPFHTGCKACIVDSVELHSFLSTLLYHAMDLLVGGYVTGTWLA